MFVIEVGRFLYSSVLVQVRVQVGYFIGIEEILIKYMLYKEFEVIKSD